MTDGLIFYFIKEFNQTRNMSGKIWRIKVLSGELKVMDNIRIYGFAKGKKKSDEMVMVEATIKSIYQEVGFGSEPCDVAEEGDVVTIDIKNCYSNGYKIDKSELFANNSTIGVGENTVCSPYNNLFIAFHGDVDLIDKLNTSLESKRNVVIPDDPFFDEEEDDPLSDIKRYNTYEVILLWFGKSVPILVDKIGFNKNDDFIVNFRTRKGEIFIPDSKELRQHIEHTVIKDCILSKEQGRNVSGVHEWRYFGGNIIFDAEDCQFICK